ncbi:trypsin-1 isoform X2 [Ooceraea biroi]|uniref:trypsin-1 isoform X2 n=1 Tax=Ooceraea biroi TaxID=2015173 RepID=UPI0005BB72EF|nr:trypsin-1 isoform X2 [Ooceraea biroi]
MQIHTALTLLALLCLSHGAEVGFPGDKAMLMPLGLNGRIVNGTKAALRQFPHQVSLSRSWSLSHFCGGSIISSKLVLTAAHCMYLNGEVIQPWSIVVVGGIVKLTDMTPTRQERGVEKISIHPMFDISTLHNDVAVLQLSVSFKFTPELHNAPLAGNPIVPGTICQVAGWGYPADNIPIVSLDLMYVDLPIRSVDECRKLLKNITNLPDGMFCAGYLDGGKDACQGDSGGGMVCNGILTGVVSGGEGCARPLFPGVYADVYYYLNWITNNEAIVISGNFSRGNSTRRNNDNA